MCGWCQTSLYLSLTTEPIGRYNSASKLQGLTFVARFADGRKPVFIYLFILCLPIFQTLHQIIDLETFLLNPKILPTSNKSPVMILGEIVGSLTILLTVGGKKYTSVVLQADLSKLQLFKCS